VATGGHVPGHQSVLVRLPETGPVLLAIDAVPAAAYFDPGTGKRFLTTRTRPRRGRARASWSSCQSASGRPSWSSATMPTSGRPSATRRTATRRRHRATAGQGVGHSGWPAVERTP
jgi:hypothetical protein